MEVDAASDRAICFGPTESERPPLPSVADIWRPEIERYLRNSEIPDLASYIPAGCLRINRKLCNISSEDWTACREWKLIGHPIDGSNPKMVENLVPGPIENNLQNHPFLADCRHLFYAALIRLEFKARDSDLGQVRVYIYPDDVAGHLGRDESFMRTSKIELLSRLDIAKDTWDGTWALGSPILQIETVPNSSIKEQNDSLLDLFNNLPSPNPDLNIIKDPYAREAMSELLENQVEGITTKLYPYQQRSAAMMLQREYHPARVLDPRLQRLKDLKGGTWYCDVFRGICRRDTRVYEFARGGICAETMGLGKTLICLALILATRDISSQIPAEYSVDTHPIRSKVGSLVQMSASSVARNGTPWRRALNYFDAGQSSEYTRCIEAIHNNRGYYLIPYDPPQRVTRHPVIRDPRKVYLSATTLVVVPANLVRQWEHEISIHTTGLKVLVMKDKGQKLPPALELLEYDIILFSRTRFELESKDGSDSLGRRSMHTNCLCRRFNRVCDCFNTDNVYLSPLREIHFQRLITDEGHTMGNSSSKSKSQAVLVVDFLQVTSRWIVSGTPAPGLYGLDMKIQGGHFEIVPDPESLINFDLVRPNTSSLESENAEADGEHEDIGSFMEAETERERKDLEKLGNIAINYLKSAPWANKSGGDDVVPWHQYVLQPRHSVSSRGTPKVLRRTLESMIIRHRPEDVLKDIELPPLHQRTIYLEGTLLDKISLNLFALMINSNAVTSERKDADYLFHPRQRPALGSLVANLRQASFFWSGFIESDVQVTIDIAQKYRDNPDIVIPENDRRLLEEGINIGKIALSTRIWRVASANHEMPMYVFNECSPSLQSSWALDEEAGNPTLLGGTQLRSFQNLASPRQDPIRLQKLIDAGILAQKALKDSLASNHYRGRSRVEKIVKKLAVLQKHHQDLTGDVSVDQQVSPRKMKRKLENASPALAGGVKVGEEFSPRKKQVGRRSSLDDFQAERALELTLRLSPSPPTQDAKQLSDSENSASAMQTTSIPQIANANISDIPQDASTSPIVDSGYSSPRQMLDSMMLVSTASAKLSYLIDQVLKYQKEEKIIIFYENENVAYYIAQALEVVNVQHLIYAKTLSTERRSQYVVTFNISSRFRCLLMDISQAAFGLDLSSASRVYFVNPVLSMQVEAQAVKRAHRIGQRRPVHVETLVLRSSIEEAIMERRKSMNRFQQAKCKTVLDDETLYDWIKNVSFVPLPEITSGPEQMAALETPIPIFGHDSSDSAEHDPDSGIIIDGDTSSQSRKKSGGQRSLPIPRLVDVEDSPPTARSWTPHGGNLVERNYIPGRVERDASLPYQGLWPRPTAYTRTSESPELEADQNSSSVLGVTPSSASSEVTNQHIARGPGLASAFQEINQHIANQHIARGLTPPSASQRAAVRRFWRNRN